MTSKNRLPNNPLNGIKPLKEHDVLYYRPKVAGVPAVSSPVERVVLPQEALALVLEDVHLMRQGNRYQNKMAREGFFMSTPTRPIWHESLVEKDALLALTFKNAHHTISSQPFGIVFAQTNQPNGKQVHYPDFFAINRDGIGIVIDVKPLRFQEREQPVFDRTRAICEQVGWEYHVIPELESGHKTNLTFLSGLRHTRFRPAPHIRDHLRAALTTPRTIAQVRELVKTMPGAELPHVWNLLWHGDLHCHMSEPFTLDTLLWS